MPYFRQHFIEGNLGTPDGKNIHYAKCELPGDSGALVVVTGRTEYMAKYSEAFYDLRDLGISFYIYDHRGQGESSRLLPDLQKGHVERFNDYVEDLHLFLNTVVRAGNHDKVFLLSHSMGGAVSVLHQRKYPGMVAGMILCSPMFSVNSFPFPLIAAKILSRLLSHIGFGTRYVFGGKPYDRHQPFEHNELTDSFARFQLNKKRVEENPKVELGSPTIGWLTQAFDAIERIRKDTSPLRIPLLILVGEEDIVVGRRAQQKFCDGRADCSLIVLPRGKHELLMEKDQVRDQVLSYIREFIINHSVSTPLFPSPE